MIRTGDITQQHHQRPAASAAPYLRQFSARVDGPQSAADCQHYRPQLDNTAAANGTGHAAPRRGAAAAHSHRACLRRAFLIALKQTLSGELKPCR